MDNTCIGLAITVAYVAVAALVTIVSKKKLAKNGCPSNELDASAMVCGVYWPIALLVEMICLPTIEAIDFVYKSLEKDN